MLDAEGAARRDYLVLLSDMQFEGARHGFLLSRASFCDPYSCGFTRRRPLHFDATVAKSMFPQLSIPDVDFIGDPEKRRRTYWQPAANAPAAFQVAWLLDSFAEDTGGFVDARLQLTRMTVSPAGHADIAVRRKRDGEHACTIRVLIEGRTEPLDFPAMYIRDIFEGRHPRWSAGAGDVPRLIDLRSML